MELGEICMLTSFRSDSRDKGAYQGLPNFYIDFNNGTVIPIYKGTNDGDFYGCIHLPEGLGEYAVDIFNQYGKK